MKFERQLAWPCRDCEVRGLSLCRSLTDRVGADTPASKKQIPQVFFRIDKGAIVQESGSQFIPGPYLLCQGWAYRFYRFPDGRRQILSVIIPGDLFSAFALVNTQSGFSVQAATDIHVCQFGRAEIRNELSENPEFCEAFGRLCADEVEDIARTSINLTSADPAARVAGFVRTVVDRLATRGIGSVQNVYPFPLTHLEIADATGLTPVEVGEAVHILQNEYVISLANGQVRILDPAKIANPASVAIR